MNCPALLFYLSFLLLSSCQSNGPSPVPIPLASKTENRGKTVAERVEKRLSTVHVLVALCDNKYQGIVPVGAAIGNGQDPASNLYWGCQYGLKTHFTKRTSEWNLVRTEKKISDTILERLLFRHKTEPVYLLAEAYNGRFISETMKEFFSMAAGWKSMVLQNGSDTVHFGGASNLVVYIGHDGLMDFSLPLVQKPADTRRKEAVMLSCYSKDYFAPHLYPTQTYPLIWTTGLMAPEAYTLHDALSGWVLRKTGEEVRQAAAAAYARYQKCSVKAARNLLVTGW